MIARPPAVMSATVTVAPASGSATARVRQDGATRDAPARVSSTVTTAITAGKRVFVTVVGQRLLITGAP